MVYNLLLCMIERCTNTRHMQGTKNTITPTSFISEVSNTNQTTEFTCNSETPFVELNRVVEEMSEDLHDCGRCPEEIRARETDMGHERETGEELTELYKDLSPTYR